MLQRLIFRPKVSAAANARTAHRVEQFKRERLAGKWRDHLHPSDKPLKPSTVNRELDTFRSVFSRAVEWGKLLEHPMRAVKRLKVDNRRTRILSETEQAALLKACPKKLSRVHASDERAEGRCSRNVHRNDRWAESGQNWES